MKKVSAAAPTPFTEDQLREMFEANFERLRKESGHSLGRDVRDAAWDQVLGYWHKLRFIAETVTDTEVKLNLPNQRTPKGRSFCIEGVVDIVRSSTKVTMYDLKTHELSYVRQNISLYRDQLNVYAHIWTKLRGEPLDETAIIATPVPEDVRAALRAGDRPALATALARWEPVVPIQFEADNVADTIAKFAKVVDCIEDRSFHPPKVAVLSKGDGERGTFASRVCRNCDLRFSCSSYRDYASHKKDRSWTKFADFYDLAPDESEEAARFLATIPDEVEL